MSKYTIKNLSNKFPTKDITKDDKINKLPLSTSKKNKKIISLGDGIVFGQNSIPIIAGPNGVENYKLMYETAKCLKKNKISIIRGHAYKPLTFPLIQFRPLVLPNSVLSENNTCIPTQIPRKGFFLILMF